MRVPLFFRFWNDLLAAAPVDVAGFRQIKYMIAGFPAAVSHSSNRARFVVSSGSVARACFAIA